MAYKLSIVVSFDDLEAPTEDDPNAVATDIEFIAIDVETGDRVSVASNPSRLWESIGHAIQDSDWYFYPRGGE